MAESNLRVIVVLGLVWVLAGLAARHFLFRAVDESSFDPSCLPDTDSTPFIKTPNRVVEEMVALAQLTDLKTIWFTIWATTTGGS